MVGAVLDRKLVAAALPILIALFSCSDDRPESLAGPYELARLSLVNQGIVGMTRAEAQALLQGVGVASRFREVECTSWSRLGIELSPEEREKATVIAATRPKGRGAAWYVKTHVVLVDELVVDVRVGHLFSGC